MAEIKVLDQHTAELIAAGEVVERPASVVKELMENAVDAGATQIGVTIEKGGISFIQVSDNGTGIPAESLPTAFIRHATSKITSENDLENIHTLGFRGEALPSIASVARVQVLTRTEQDEFACVYRMEGGQEKGIEPSARPVGTTIEVRDIFYNTPARMKFLKKDSSEATFVGETVGHIALSHPEISISYTRDGKQQYKTPGDGKLRSAVYAVLGREFAKDLLNVDESENGYRIQGLITPPRCCRASRGMQHFFINGRYVKNRTMMAALENAYRGTLMQGRFPGCVMMLTMPCELVDVNVHPAKTEVRFSREKDVFDAVYRATKMGLDAPESGHRILNFSENAESKNVLTETQKNKNEIAFSLKDDTVRQKDITGCAGGFAPKSDLNSFTYEAPQPARQHYWPEPDISVMEYSSANGSQVCSKPASLSAKPGFAPAKSFSDLKDDSVPQLKPESNLYDEHKEDDESDLPAVQPEQASFVQDENEAEQLTVEEPEKLRYLGEAFKTYIITQRGEEICFIDKHAAHERIIYERIAKDYGKPGSQMLLAPVTVNLSADEKQAVLENILMLADAGIEVEDFGGSTMLVRSVPADIPVNDAEDLLCELAAKLARGAKDARSEHTQWVLHSISCRAAVKAGDHSRMEELMSLAQDILDGKVPPFCPHGRPVVLRLTKKELEKQFGRLG